MKKNSILMLAFLVVLVFGVNTTPAQFPIKLPKLKVDKPKPERPKPDDSRTTQTQDASTTTNDRTQPINSDSKKVYGGVRPPAAPVFLTETVYLQAKTTRTYWKMPKESDYTSWVPTVRFGIFYDWNKPMNYMAEYYNPDGSLWFSEQLEGGNRDNERVISFQSDRTDIDKMLETKASVGTGTYVVKIINKETKETVFQGKFKVSKFLRPYSERTPNRYDFFVEHDWLLPVAYVGFHFSYFDDDENVGGCPVIVSTWLKGDVNDEDLEARLFYQGRQIASTQRGSSDGRYWGKRASEFAAIAPEPPVWKLFNFEWANFLFDNGGGFNHDNYPNAHYADKNPGEYTVKIYRKGIEVREFKFNIQPDGKLSDGGFAKQIYLPYHKIIVPAKVMGNLEKWNASVWKTDAFYGNPLTGFAVP